MKFVFPLALVLACAGSLRAEVTLSKVFTPHMVLQRGMPVPIYGTAAAGEKVTVKFRDQSKTADTGQDGKWLVKLDALQAGGPDVLSIGDKRIDDVLVGEVWVGSGQSNMDTTVTFYGANDPVLVQRTAVTYPKLRILKKGPAEVWQIAGPETLPSFSALLFSFGLPLQKELEVPVGLMVGAVGGTPSGYWLTEEMFKADAACTAAATSFDIEAAKATYQKDKAAYDEALAKYKPLAEAAKAEGKPVPKPPRAPQPVTKPGEIAGTAPMGNLYEAHVRPYVGYGIRGVLWDQGEAGTRITGVGQLEVMGALIRGWRKAWGQGDFPFLYVQKASGLGCAWEYDTPLHSKADKFSPLPTVVPASRPGGSLHEYYTRIMQNPKTYMVTSSDLGSGIHPTNKSAYGQRAELVAMRTVYGAPGEFCGPIYASQTIEGNKVRIKFTHVGKGLAFRNDDKLQGFAIAGADRKFVWAEAAIDGETVVVSSPEVEKPEAVHYAQSSGMFTFANLFNQDELPAAPFATDRAEHDRAVGVPARSVVRPRTPAR